METPEKLEARLRWALALLRSPRVRESDAAALLLRLLFRKYALDLGWDVRLTPEPKATPPPPGSKLPSRAETGARLLGECYGGGAGFAFGEGSRGHTTHTLFWVFWGFIFLLSLLPSRRRGLAP